MTSDSILVGDIVSLNCGECVMFDGILIDSADEFRISEAARTGEPEDLSRREANAENLEMNENPFVLKSHLVT